MFSAPWHTDVKGAGGLHRSPPPQPTPAPSALRPHPYCPGQLPAGQARGAAGKGGEGGGGGDGGGGGKGKQEEQEQVAAPLSVVQSDSELQLPAGSALPRYVEPTCSGAHSPTAAVQSLEAVVRKPQCGGMQPHCIGSIVSLQWYLAGRTAVVPRTTQAA